LVASRTPAPARWPWTGPGSQGIPWENHGENHGEMAETMGKTLENAMENGDFP